MRNTCPKCNAAATVPRLDLHPGGRWLREAAFWLVGVGFVLATLCYFFTNIGDGRGIGWNLVGVMLAPASVPWVLSLFFPHVWVVTCPACRTEFFRRPRTSEWKASR